MNEGSRYSSLRDYLRVLRERRVLIIACVLVCAGAALALSVREDAVYQAESALSFEDATEETDLLGTPTPQRQGPAERSAQGAEVIGRPTVVNVVAKQFTGRLTPGQVASAASARVDSRSNLVIVQTKADSPELAKRLADAYAQAAFRDAVDRSRLRFRRAAEEVRRQFRALAPAERDQATRAIYGDRLTRLEILARTVIPVQVVRRASAPADPVSPKPVRNTLLGALLGLTLGLVFAFGRDALDRRLRGASEIAEEVEWPVLGHVRETAMGRAAPFSSNGRKSLEPLDLETFRILRANLMYLNIDDPPRIVLVTSAMPAEGKTTVSASLAYASAAAGRRTVLVECDLRRPVLADRLGVTATPGLIDHLLGEADPAAVLREIPIDPVSESGNGEKPEAAGGRSRMAFIPAGRPTARAAELLQSKRFATVLAELAATYDMVVLDTSPLLSVADTIELLPRADARLLCVRARQTTRDQVHAAREIIERVPAKPTGVVVTGLRHRDEVDYGYYSYAYASENK